MKTLTAVLLGTAVVASAAQGQVARGQLDVTAGTATDQRGVRSNAVSISPAFVVSPDERLVASLALNGTRYAANTSSVGGSANIATRQSLGGPFFLGLSGGGAYTLTSLHASYGALDATPTLESTLSRLTLFAGAHFGAGRTSFGTKATAPCDLLCGPPLPHDTVASRTLAGAIFGAAVNLSGFAPGQTGGANYREEHVSVGGARVVDRSATAGVASGDIAASVSLGYRDAADERTGFGSAGATWGVSRAFALTASAGSYPSNRILGVVGGRFASVGVSIRGSRGLDDVQPATMAIAGAPPVTPGMTRFFVTAPHASRVEIAGDWNAWTPAPATRAANGTWYADVKLAHGEYRYAFRIDNQKWDVPSGVPSIDDGYGGRSALVSVR